MKKRPTQFFIGIGILLSLALLVLVGIVTYLNTNHGKNLIQAKVNEAIPGTVSCEKLRCSILRGDLELSHVVLRGPNEENVAGFDRLFVDLAWTSLLKGNLAFDTVVLEKPWATILKDREGEINLVRAVTTPKPKGDRVEAKDTGALPINVVVKTLRMVQGHLRYEIVDTGFKAMAQDIDLSANGNVAERSGKFALQIGQGGLTSPDFQWEFENLCLEAGLEKETIDPFVFEANTASSKLVLSGNVHNVFSKPSLDLILDLNVSLTELREWFRVEPISTGQVLARMVAQGMPDNPEVAIQLDYGGGILAGRQIDGIALRGQLKDRFFKLDQLQAHMASGGLNLHGEADLREAFRNGLFVPKSDLEAISYKVFLEEEGVKLGQLLGSAGGFHGTVSSQLSIHGRGISPKSLSAEAVLEIFAKGLGTTQAAAPVDLHISTQGRLNQGVATIKQLTATAGGNTLFTRGHFDLVSKEVGGTLRLDAPSLEETLFALGFKETHGLIKLEADVSGSVMRPVVHCTLRGDQLRFQDITIGDVRLRASLNESGVLQVLQLAVQNQGSTIQGAGSIQVFEDALVVVPASPLKFSLALRDAEIKDFLNREIATGIIDGGLRLDGSTKALRGALTLQGKGMAVRKIRLGDIDVDLRLSEGMLYVDQARVNNQGSALRMWGTAQVMKPETMQPLKDPTFDLNLQGEAVAIQDFVDELKGNITLAARLHGNMTRPRGTLELHGMSLDLGVQKLKEITIHSKLDGEKIGIKPLQIVLAPGEVIQGKGWVSLKKAYEFALASQGISLQNIDKLRALNFPQGKMRFDIAGAGSLAAPRIEGNIALCELRVGGKALDDCGLHVAVRDQLASISGKLDFELNGSFHLEDKTFSASILFDETNLGPYFKIAGHPDLDGMVTGKLEATGNTGAIGQIKAIANLSKLTLGLKGQEVIRAEHFKVSLEEQELSVPGLHLVLLNEGEIEIKGKGKRDGLLAFEVGGHIPLRLVSLFVEDLADMTGDLVLSGTIGGTQSRPDLRAEIGLKEIGFTIPEVSQRLHHVNGRFQITPEAVDIDRIEGQLGSGRFDLAGRVDLERLKPGEVRLRFTANALPLQIPDTMDLLVNTELKIQGTNEQSTVEGEIIILEGTYYRDVNLSLLQAVGERKREEAPPPKEMAHPLLKNVTLDISIKRRNPFLVENNLAELEINPDLRVTGKLNNPIIRGRAAVDSGTLYYRKKSFVVKKGVIDFLNPYKTEPTIDIQSEAKIRRWLVFLAISGTPDELSFKLTSDPPEEDGDILSLLVTGKTTRELIDGEGGTPESTSQMLAEVIASRYSEDVKAATGLDILEVQEGEEGEETSDVKVTVGKKLSKRMLVKYAAESKDGEMIEKAIAEYKFLENILVNGFQDSKGTFGGELQFRLEFR
jgi:autotransporter translocation and assembly factor TamB